MEMDNGPQVVFDTYKRCFKGNTVDAGMWEFIGFILISFAIKFTLYIYTSQFKTYFLMLLNFNRTSSSGKARK